MKFDTAYNTHIQKNVSIQEVAKLYRINRQKFYQEYKGQLLCPICLEAELVYNNRFPQSYFSTSPKSIHAANCAKKQDENKKRTLIKTGVPVSTDNSIRTQLQRLIISLNSLDENPQKGKPQKRKTISKLKKVSQQNEFQYQVKTALLPQRNITLGIRDSEYGITAAYYGKVKIEWRVGTRDKCHWIILHHPDKPEQLLCTIKLTISVFENIPESYKNIDKTVCYIALKAQFKKTKSAHATASLQHSGFLFLDKVAKDTQ